MALNLQCWNCGAQLLDVPVPVSRHESCPQCFTEVRCCRMCKYFDAQVRPDQCREDRAEPPLNKETANFCEWFAPVTAGTEPGRGDPDRTDKAAQAKAALDALFAPKSKD